MNLEVEPEKALAANYVPTKEDIERLRIKLNYSVRMFKKVRRVNNNLKQDDTERRVQELKKSLNELTRKFDYFAALMIQEKHISIKSSVRDQSAPLRKQTYEKFKTAALK